MIGLPACESSICISTCRTLAVTLSLALDNQRTIASSNLEYLFTCSPLTTTEVQLFTSVAKIDEAYTSAGGASAPMGVR